MKILILTTYYPPDTAISAVRPYMFAKYLAKKGHEVTVVRSGEINKQCGNFFAPLTGVRVLSYLGENSMADKYEKGDIADAPKTGESRVGFLPHFLRRPIAKIYHMLTYRRDRERRLAWRLACYEKQKILLDSLKNETFDIVFSTAGEFENMMAGSYAAQLFSCPLIQDFRDTMAVKSVQTKKEYAYMKSLQDRAVEEADACTVVSEGALCDICEGLSPKETMVLYNGYEPAEMSIGAEKTKQLTFCYTGQFYEGKQDFSPILRAVSHLVKEGKINADNIRIHYAGKDFAYLLQTAKPYGLADILENHGYVDRQEAVRIQAQSDIFTVLSWNTPTSKGILTGKFYEGIRAEKPILAVVAGNLADSELYRLNQKYNYGFCYETAREPFAQLCDYIEQSYNEKMSSDAIAYAPNPELKTDFRYDVLTEKLEALCERLTRLQ